MNLMDLAKNFTTEESAFAFLEKHLCPSGPVCPHCGLLDAAFRMQSKLGTKNKMRPGVWKCKGCRKTFRVTVGTIFEDSHIPLHKWLMAMHLMCASKKGMSAHQLHRMLGLGYRAAWFMAHRIRYAMTDTSEGKLSGPAKTVEADETYVGGKRRGTPRGRPGIDSHKAPVVALVERRGRVRSFHVERVTANNLKAVLRENVEPETGVMTDDFSAYDGLKNEFASHDVVTHSAGEYVRHEQGRSIHTNTAESFFSLLKRGVYGTFHHVSKHHLHRYLSEFDFRYNARDVADGERTELAIKGVQGKRLTYRER